MYMYLDPARSFSASGPMQDILNSFLTEDPNKLPEMRKDEAHSTSGVFNLSLL